MRTRTPVLRAALRIALPPVLAVTGLTAAAAPSSATPAIGSSWLDVLLIPGGFDVCVDGEVPVSMRYAGTWTLSISGIRADGSGNTWMIDNRPWTSTAWKVVDHCEPIYTLGYPYGEMQVDWGYAGAGDYLLVHSTGGAVWDPQFGENTWGVNPTT